jgi:hypothetical protein
MSTKNLSRDTRIANLFGGKKSAEDIIQQDKLTAAAIAAKQLEEAEKETRFIAHIPGSKPTAAQKAFIDCFVEGKYRNIFARGGNQCFTTNTLVATPDGPRQIGDLQVGDFVLDPDNKPIQVLAVHDNGEKQVFDYTNRGKVKASCTETHKFLTYKHPGKKTLNRATKGIREIGDSAVILHTHALLQVTGGMFGAEEAWAYGALQGDGCCTCSTSKTLVISSQDSCIPDRLAKVTGTSARRMHESNYNWAVPFTEAVLPLYGHFAGKKAHEKYLPWEVIKAFDTAEALAFLAGLLDTDGSMAFDSKAKAGYICWTTQNAEAAKQVSWLLCKFFRIESFLHTDRRPKYKNGDILSVKITNPHEIATVCEALLPYVVLGRKVNAAQFLEAGSKSHADCITLLKDETSARREHVRNITVDHPENLYQLANGLISKNSGKSNTCAYLIAGLLKETLPGWKRQEKWHKQPLLIIWLSRQSKQIEGSLFAKLKPYLKPGSYHEHRQGGSLQHIEMRDSGNKLIFISYQNVNEARDAVQSFTSHYVFLDELPSKASIIEEAQNRVLVNSGIFVAAFTPKRPAPEVKRLVANADKRFTTGFVLRMEDNPGIDELDKEMQRLKAAQYGAKMEAAILEGDWVDGENQVFFLDDAKIIRELPKTYSTNWVHWESSDPANASGFGLLVAAQDPISRCWWIVKARTLVGPEIECPSTSVATVKRETSQYNMVKRIYDCAANFYAREARKMGLKYTPCMSKYLTFEESIDRTQEAIGRTLFITPDAQDLLDELYNYQRSEDNPEHIIHKKKFHMVDSLRYLVMSLPREKQSAPPEENAPWDEHEAVPRLLDQLTKGEWTRNPNSPPKKVNTFSQKLKRVNTWFRKH